MTESNAFPTDEGSFYTALALYLREKFVLDYTPEIIGTRWDEGGEVQIGDVTWIYEDPGFVVTYREPARVAAYQHYPQEVRLTGDFGTLVMEIAKQTHGNGFV